MEGFRLPLPFDIAGVVPVRVRLTDPTISVMDFQFRLGISADLTTAIHCILFDVEVAARSIATSSTDVPSAVGVRDHVMGAPAALTFGHWRVPFVLP